LLFKTYFRLNSISLSRNVLKALHAYKGDMPPFEGFPRPQKVTFKYYEGVLSFLEENYAEVLLRFESNYCEQRNADIRQAEKHLTEAWMICPRGTQRNKE
jgi:COP9 signalosome complex subunit 12